MLLFAHVGLALASARFFNSVSLAFLALGSMLPDIIDKPLGHIFLASSLGYGRIYSHTLLFLTIATLENRDIKKDAVITGTINEDGSIGQIGSVLEKTKAVSDAGYKYFLIPEGQADVIYYERQVERRSTDLGFDIMRSKYVPKTLNISQAAKEELGLNVVEVSNIDKALPYFFED